MGGSGGGKTTLLSTLSLRLDSKAMNITGTIRLNGREYDKATLKSMSAYVMQDDVMLAELTVLEVSNLSSIVLSANNLINIFCVAIIRL